MYICSFQLQCFIWKHAVHSLFSLYRYPVILHLYTAATSPFFFAICALVALQYFTLSACVFAFSRDPYYTFYFQPDNYFNRSDDICSKVYMQSMFVCLYYCMFETMIESE